MNKRRKNGNLEEDWTFRRHQYHRAQDGEQRQKQTTNITKKTNNMSKTRPTTEDEPR